MWRLTVQGPGVRMELYLTPGQTYRVGRAPDNPIVIPDPTISRYHATVQALPDRVVLHDLGSKNGTFVNGRRVQEAVEVFGFEDIRLGRVILLLERVPTSAPGPSDPGVTPSAQEMTPLCPEILAGLQADRQVVEDLFVEWQASAEDPERAVHKALQICIHQGLFQRVAVLRTDERDRRTVLLDTEPDPPPTDLLTWALQVAAAGPRMSALRLRPPEAPSQGPRPEDRTFVLALPLNPRAVVLFWVDAAQLGSPVFRSRLLLVFWLIRCWDAGVTVPLPLKTHMGAWAPFPFWGFSPAVYRLIRHALTVAPLSTPVAIIGPPGSGKTALARWLHELGRPQGAFSEWDLSRPDDPYGPSLRRPEGPESRLWWPLHRGTVVIRNAHAADPDVQERLTDWVIDPWVTVEGTRQRLDIRWVLIAEDTPRSTGPPRRPLAERLVDVFSDHVLTVPALAERREDLPYLANYLVRQTSQGRILGLAEAALTPLLTHAWPGNVRELRQVLEKAVAAALAGEETPGPLLQASHVLPFLS